MIPKEWVFEMEAKNFLASYRACRDCKRAIETLGEKTFLLSEWRVSWAGICSLLKTSIVLLGKRDAQSCFSENLRQSLKAAWDELRIRKADFPIFWEFIDRERNNVLKQYDFSAYSALLKSDGTIEPNYSLLGMFTEASKEILLLKGGVYDGRFALDVAAEAASWVQGYIEEAIRKGGVDPDAKVSSREFLRSSH